MTQSEFPDSQVPVEIEKPVATDFNQAQQTDSSLESKPISILNKKRPWPVILGVVLLIAGVGVGWRWWQTSQASNAPPGAAAGKPMGIPVKLATVENATIQESSQFNGTLDAPRSVTLKPEIDARITEILFKEGDRISQGQVVIRLQSDDAQAQLQQAKASLEQARARLAELKAGTRAEEIAQARAQLAQAQARLRDAQTGARPEEMAQAEAQIDAAKSDLALAKSRAERYGKLQKEGAISEDLMAGYVKEERSASASLVVAQRRLEQLSKGRTSDISELQAAVEQQRQNLRQLENGPRQEEIAQARSQVSQAAAQVKAAQVQLQYTNVRAPFTGTIARFTSIAGEVRVPVRVGDFVSKGDQLATLTRNDSLELNISVPLTESQRLRVGLPVQILDDRGQPTATGKISFISPNAKSSSQAVLAKATFSNGNRQLLNGQSISKIKIIWNEPPGILIPVTAVSRLGGETFVFVAQAPENPKPGAPSLVAIQKPVKLGAIEGSNYQVLEGLKTKEKIVVSGILNLTNGAAITPTP